MLLAASRSLFQYTSSCAVHAVDARASNKHRVDGRLRYWRGALAERLFIAQRHRNVGPFRGATVQHTWACTPPRRRLAAG